MARMRNQGLCTIVYINIIIIICIRYLLSHVQRLINMFTKCCCTIQQMPLMLWSFKANKRWFNLNLLPCCSKRQLIVDLQKSMDAHNLSTQHLQVIPRAPVCFRHYPHTHWLIYPLSGSSEDWNGATCLHYDDYLKHVQQRTVHTFCTTLIVVCWAASVSIAD